MICNATTDYRLYTCLGTRGVARTSRGVALRLVSSTASSMSTAPSPASEHRKHEEMKRRQGLPLGGLVRFQRTSSSRSQKEPLRAELGRVGPNTWVMLYLN
ncbi:hypothetical protein CRG98_034146 [Punica granatum]|uniref:Uncharacterized protein n=1 Tax=Punica granatum TaxID=22663 RepID=A0A2I0INA2_PUNGR|nr:hypothetical protein CRG98_034146 [Punica granatum]